MNNASYGMDLNPNSQYADPLRVESRPHRSESDYTNPSSLEMSTITNPLLQMSNPHNNGLVTVHVEKLNRSLRWMTGLLVLVAVLVCVAIGMLAFQFFIVQREPSAGKDEDQPRLPINSNNCTNFKTVHGQICEKVKILMKLKAGSDTFYYDSHFWTQKGSTHQIWLDKEGWSDNDNMDVKYSAFDDQPLSALLICYKSLDNCYKFSLGKEFPSARALFTGGYRAYPNLGGGGGKEAWSSMFVLKDGPAYAAWKSNPSSQSSCPMMEPGINSVKSGNKVRIGFSYRQREDSCWKDVSTEDTDGSMGIGITTQDKLKINAPFGGYLETNSKSLPKITHQAWLFAIVE